MKRRLVYGLMASSMAFFSPDSAQAEPESKPHSQPSTKPAMAEMKDKTMDHSMDKMESKGMVHETAESAKPLQPGSMIPKSGGLKNAKGESVSLSDLTTGKTTVLVFYRGGWCPYCTTQLAELAIIRPELEKEGVQIIGISPDSVEKLAAYQEENEMPYTLLSDTNLETMKAFGIAFTVDQDTQSRYKNWGIQLNKGQGDSDPSLPVPSVFVIQPDGKISFSHSDPDYKVRPSGDEILKAAKLKPMTITDKIKE